MNKFIMILTNVFCGYSRKEFIFTTRLIADELFTERLMIVILKPTMIYFYVRQIME